MLRRAAALASSAAPRFAAPSSSMVAPRLLSVRSLHTASAPLFAIDRASLLRRLSDEKARPAAGKARAAESAAADEKAKADDEKAAIEAAWAKVEAEMQEEYERTGGASQRPPTNDRERAREQERRARGGSSDSRGDRSSFRGDQRRGSGSGDEQPLDPKLRRRPRREPGPNSPHRGKGVVKEDWPLERISKICTELLQAGRAGANLDPELRAKYQSTKANIEAEVTRAAQIEAEKAAEAAAAAAAGATATPTMDAAATPAAPAAAPATPSADPASSTPATPAAATASADGRPPLPPPSISPPELRVFRWHCLDGITIGRDGVLEYAFPRLNSFVRHLVHTTAEFIGEGEITHGSVGEGLHRHIVLRYIGKEAAERNKKEKAEAEAAAKARGGN